MTVRIYGLCAGLCAASLGMVLLSTVWFRASSSPDATSLSRQAFPDRFIGTVAIGPVEYEDSTVDRLARQFSPGDESALHDLSIHLPSIYNGTTTVQHGDVSLRSRPLGAAPVYGAIQQDGTVVFESVYPGIDVVHHGSQTGIEEFFIVHNQGENGKLALSKRLDLRQPDGTHLQATTTDEGRVQFTDANGLTRLQMTAPVGRDSDGQLVDPENLHWSIEGDDLVLVASLDEYAFPVVIDPSWQAPGQLPPGVGAVRGSGIMADGQLMILTQDNSLGARRYTNIYNPAIQGWALVSDWPVVDATPNQSFVLSDGRILWVFTQRSSVDTNYIFIYSPNLNTWSAVNSPAQMINSFCRLNDGSFMFVSGSYRGLTNSHIYRPDVDLWDAPKPLLPGLGDSDNRDIINPQLLPMNEADAILIGTTTTQRWNEATQQWAASAPLPHKIDFYHPWLLLPYSDGRLLYSRGDSWSSDDPNYIMFYSPVDDSWETAPAEEGLPKENTSFFARHVVLPDGDIASRFGTYDLTNYRASTWPDENVPDSFGTPLLSNGSLLHFVGNSGVQTIDLRPVLNESTVRSHWNTPAFSVDLASIIGSRGMSPVVTMTQNPSQGVAQLQGLTLTYTPEVTPFVGSDSISLVIRDEHYPNGPTQQLTIEFTNTPPVAASETIQSPEDRLLQQTLPGSDGDGDALTFAILSQPDLGAVTLDNAQSGAFTLLPPANTSGTTSFQYSASDGVDTAIGTVTVVIVPVNDAPSFSFVGNPSITVPETAIPFVRNQVGGFDPGPSDEQSQGVLDYDTSTDRPELFASAPEIGTDGILTFTPSGLISVTSTAVVSVRVRDDGGVLNEGVDTSPAKTFTITLEPVPDTLLVTNTNDSGPGSLREQLAIARSGDTIQFDDFAFNVDNSGASTVINVLSQLPPLSHGGVTIDAKDRKVSLNGSAAVNAEGLQVTSSGNRIEGLTILAFTRNGIRLSGDASDNVIGGDRTSGSGPNGAGMRIADCGGSGIHLEGIGARRNTIEGCWVGLFASGLLSGPNLTGIVLDSGPSENRIGSTSVGRRNVVSGNTFEGIAIIGAGSSGNRVVGNLIGLAAVEEFDRGTLKRPVLGNGGAGVFLSLGTKGNQIGGKQAGEGNQIFGSGGAGIEVRSASSSGNSAFNNSISQNASSGIGLFNGANGATEPPTVLSVGITNGASTWSVSGRAPRATGTVQLFSDPADEGEVFLASVEVTDAVWSASIPAIPSGRNITATFTDSSGNTSSFGYATPASFDRRIRLNVLGVPAGTQTLINDLDLQPLDQGEVTNDSLSNDEAHKFGFVTTPESSG